MTLPHRHAGKGINEASLPGQALLARQRAERRAATLFRALSLLPVVLFGALLLVLVLRFLPILRSQGLAPLLLGRSWHPGEGTFGFLPFIAGSLWVTVLAMLISAPISLMVAVYLAEYATPLVRSVLKPVTDILAAIPSVVYGMWGVLVIVPWVGNTLKPASQRLFPSLPFLRSDNPTGYTIVAGALVLAVMVSPFIIAVCSEVMRTVPRGFREASLALGATRWQTVRHVIFPRVAPGLAAGVILGTSRAFGETMAVLMVVGNNPVIPRSIFDAAYPLPAMIANNYGEMMSISLYDSALMGAALILLVIVFLFTILSTIVLRRVSGRGQP